jgi:hypothetical protein
MYELVQARLSMTSVKWAKTLLDAKPGKGGSDEVWLIH